MRAADFSNWWAGRRVAALAPLLVLSGAKWGRPESLGSRALLALFACAALALAVLALFRRAPAKWCGLAMVELTCFRWIYLGGLLSSSRGPTRPELGQSDLVFYVVLFGALHWATRRLIRIDRRRFPQGWKDLFHTYQAQLGILMAELVVVLGLSLLLGPESRLSPANGLTWYLALLTVNAVLLRCVVEGPSAEPSGLERAVGSLSRVFTVLLCLAVLGGLLVHPPLALWSILLLAVGLVRGRPWGSQPGWDPTREGDAQASTEPGTTPGFDRWRALGAAALCLVLAFTLADGQQMGCAGGLDYLSLAAPSSSGWEWLDAVFGGLVLLVFAALSALMAGWLQPPSQARWTGGMAAVACLGAAIALAGVGGWMAVDPYPPSLASAYLLLLASSRPEILFAVGPRGLLWLRAKLESAP